MSLSQEQCAGITSVVVSTVPSLCSVLCDLRELLGKMEISLALNLASSEARTSLHCELNDVLYYPSLIHVLQFSPLAISI